MTIESSDGKIADKVVVDGKMCVNGEIANNVKVNGIMYSYHLLFWRQCFGANISFLNWRN